MDQRTHIRSVSRCIKVLQIVNLHGPLVLADIARLSDLPYPTASRIVQTFVQQGMIEIESSRKFYRVTALVKTLSQGFNNHNELVSVARPHIVALTDKLKWPLAITTRVGASMMVRDTTHSLTSLTFNLYPAGYVMPILECSSGHVYLAFAGEDERQIVIDGLEILNNRSPLHQFFKDDDYIDRVRNVGFATYERNPHTANPGKTSSISVPLFEDEVVTGALTLAFFVSSMPMALALGEFLPDLKRTAKAISSAMSSARSLSSRRSLSSSTDVKRGMN